MTEVLYKKFFGNEKNIKFIKIPKQVIYSGECRNAAFDLADGDIISYLDNDDVIGKKHLEIIMSEFTEDVDLVYYDDYKIMSFMEPTMSAKLLLLLTKYFCIPRTS